jgi:hypothetical protein
MERVAALLQVASQGAKLRLASVVSKAKLTRGLARSRIRDSMIRPAATAAPSTMKGDSPRAMSSAFTNSRTSSEPRRIAGAAVDLPAPFGPAMTTTLGRLWVMNGSRGCPSGPWRR